MIFFIKILVVREWESRGLQARALVDYCFHMKGVYVWQKPGSMCDKPSFFVAPDAFSEPRNKISKTRVPNDRFLDSSRRELRSPDGGESYRSPEAPGHLQRFFSELWVGRLHQGRSQWSGRGNISGYSSLIVYCEIIKIKSDISVFFLSRDRSFKNHQGSNKKDQAESVWLHHLMIRSWRWGRL